MSTPQLQAAVPAPAPTPTAVAALAAVPSSSSGSGSPSISSPASSFMPSPSPSNSPSPFTALSPPRLARRAAPSAKTKQLLASFSQSAAHLTAKITTLSESIFGKRIKKPQEMVAALLLTLEALIEESESSRKHQPPPPLTHTASVPPTGAGAPTPSSASTSTSSTSTGSGCGSSSGSGSGSPASSTTSITLVPSTHSPKISPSLASPASNPTPVNGATVPPLLHAASAAALPTSPQAALGDKENTVEKELAAKLFTELENSITLVYGDDESKAAGKVPDAKAIREFVELVIETDLLQQLLQAFHLIDFESRKRVARLYEYILGQHTDLAIEYVHDRPEIFVTLLAGYDKEISIALNSDVILQAMLQHEQLAAIMLKEEPKLVLPLVKYSDYASFEILSHAFATLKLLMTKHVELTAHYLDTNYDKFVPKYNLLLLSENYIVKLQSFQFLRTLLETRANKAFMFRYIGEVEHLKIAMISLRGPNLAVQLAVFFVLTIFVLNPRKTEGITRVLTQNRKTFVTFLEQFERESPDETVQSYRSECISTLNALDPEAAPDMLLSPASTFTVPTPQNQTSNTAADTVDT